MVPFLGPNDPLPRPESARRHPNGLLAAGGGLSVARLVDAYGRGVFPWFGEDDPVLWWCPDPRLVLPTDAVHVSRSLARRLKKGGYRITIDSAFGAVMRACAEPRADDAGTWITAEMLAAYEALHAAGCAHSLEVWTGDVLVGGIYGVAIGGAFFGESMFSRVTDGSKIAIVWLAAQLARWGVPFIDCQVRSDHLVSLGAVEVPRREFLRRLEPLVAAAPPASWRLDDDLRP
ncbi:MAG: leucyl/phenylalanyl-tRNA--protein transferase [Acidobacteriota bacterium]